MAADRVVGRHAHCSHAPTGYIRPAINDDINKGAAPDVEGVSRPNAVACKITWTEFVHDANARLTRSLSSQIRLITETR
jgi:hypothetical protein